MTARPRTRWAPRVDLEDGDSLHVTRRGGVVVYRRGDRHYIYTRGREEGARLPPVVVAALEEEWDDAQCLFVDRERKT